jgi:hypothetical protein
MTPRELHQKVAEMWPNLPTAKRDWAEQYIAVLSAYTEEEIATAWRSWHSNPDHDFSPKPYELQRRILAARPVYLGQGGETAEVVQQYPMTDDEVRRLQKTLDDLENSNSASKHRFIRMANAYMTKHYAAGGQ